MWEMCREVASTFCVVEERREAYQQYSKMCGTDQRSSHQARSDQKNTICKNGSRVSRQRWRKQGGISMRTARVAHAEAANQGHQLVAVDELQGTGWDKHTMYTNWISTCSQCNHLSPNTWRANTWRCAIKRSEWTASRTEEFATSCCVPLRFCHIKHVVEI